MLDQSGVIFEEKSFRVRSVILQITRVLGFSLIVASLAGFFIVLWPVVSAELNYRTNRNNGKQLASQQTFNGFRFLLAQTEYEQIINQDLYNSKKLAADFGISDTQFSLYIPKIQARARIIANVDPTSENAMKEALMQGVAHDAGSRFPGMDGGTYLFAHSTDVPWNISAYNAIFYLLRELEKDDEIYVFFLDKAYKYKVSEKQITDGDDTSWLTQANTGRQRLILQTCWPPGTTWKRLIIVAKPVNA